MGLTIDMTEIARMTLPNRLVVEYAVPPRAHLPRFLKSRGIQNYEPVTLAAFLASAEVSDRAVFDIGANIGIYALSAASALGRQVYAFEPFEPPSLVLRGIAERYKLPVTVVRAAVADGVGTTEFYISKKSDMSNSLNAAFRQHLSVETVDMVSVDSYSEKAPPGVIKVDTESTEMRVLRGSEETITRYRPSFLLEVLDAKISAEVTEFFSGRGYMIHELGSPEFRARLGDLSQIDCAGDLRNWLITPEMDEAGLLGRITAWLDKLKVLPIADP